MSNSTLLDKRYQKRYKVNKVCTKCGGKLVNVRQGVEEFLFCIDCYWRSDL